MKTHPKVAVVIIHWNRRALLEQFLPSVCNSTYPNLEIVLADNHSTDDSVAYVREHFPSVTIVQNDANYGYAGGYNKALKKVQADYYVLLNNDIEVTPNWIQPLVDVFEQHPTCGAVQPKLMDYTNRSLFEYAGASGGYMDFLGYVFCRGRLFDHIEADQGQYDLMQKVFWATGACLAVRADVFHQSGGFEEHFFAHMEEVDLCWRFQLMGYDIMVQPASIVYHLGGGTLDKMNARKTFLNFRNNLIMLTKNLPIATLLWLIPVRSFLDLLSSIFFISTGNFKHSAAIHKAHAAYFFNIGKWWKLRTSRNVSLSDGQLKGIYQNSIVLNYFAQGKRTFSELNLSQLK